MSKWIVLQLFFCFILFPLPHFLGYLVNGKYYTPFSAEDDISSLVYDETSFYAPQVKKLIRNGNVFMEDIFEYSNIRTHYPLFPTLFITFFSFLFGKLEYAWVFLDVFFPALFWLLGYIIMRFFSKSKLFCSLVAWLLILFPLGPRNFLFLGFESLIQPIEITRQTMPGFGLPFLFSCSLFFAFVLKKKNIWFSLVCGVISGLLFHIYYFYWIAFFTGVFTVFIFSFLMKHRELIKHIFIILISGILVGLPTLIFGVLDREVLKWTILRFAMPSRAVSVEGLIYLVLFLLPIYLIFRSREGLTRNRIILLSFFSLMVGAAFGMNFQIFSGIDMQHVYHFRNRILQPLFVIIFSILVSHLSLIERKISKVFQFLFLVTIICMGFYRHIQVFNRTIKYHDKRLPHVDVLYHASQIIPKDAVIGCTDRRIAILNSVITGNWSFLPIGVRTKAASEEILKRYFLLSFLSGDTLKEAKERYGYVSEKPGEPWLKTWIHYPYLLLVSLIDYLPPQLSEWVTLLWEKGPSPEELKTRKLDYLIIPINKVTSRLSEFYSTIRTIYQNNEWQLVYVSGIKI